MTFPATILSSLADGGVAGSADILCNGNAELLKEAGQTGGPVLPSPVEYTIVTDPDEIAAGEPETIIVDLTVDNQDIIEPGDYTFVVTLTAVPE